MMRTGLDAVITGPRVESPTYHVLSTGTGPPGEAGSMAGCELASAATAITMSAIGIHVSGPLHCALAGAVELLVHPVGSAAATLREEAPDDEKIGDVARATDSAPVHQAGGRGGRGLWRRRWHDDGR